MTESDRPDWKELAEAARDEEDPKRLMDLIHELNRVLEERLKPNHPNLSQMAS
jgi:hypothetical protein